MFRLCSPLVRIDPTGLMEFSGVDKTPPRGTQSVRVPTNLPNSNIFVRFSGRTLLWETAVLWDMGVTWLVCIGAPSFWCGVTIRQFSICTFYCRSKRLALALHYTHTITNHFNSSYTPKLLFPSAAAPHRRNSNWFLLHYQGYKTPGRSFQVSVLCT